LLRLVRQKGVEEKEEESLEKVSENQEKIEQDDTEEEVVELLVWLKMGDYPLSQISIVDMR
jgi:hypothetical protein